MTSGQWPSLALSDRLTGVRRAIRQELIMSACGSQTMPRAVTRRRLRAIGVSHARRTATGVTVHHSGQCKHLWRVSFLRPRRSPSREQRKRLLNGITPELMKISGVGDRCDAIVPAGPTTDYMVGRYYTPTRVL